MPRPPSNKPKSQPNALSRYLARRLKELELTQTDFAARLSIDQTYVSHIKRGRLPDIDAPGFIERWAAALEVTPEELITEGELWRYNIAPPGPTELRPGERAVLAAISHLDDPALHRIAQGLRAMWKEDGTVPPPEPAQEE